MPAPKKPRKAYKPKGVIHNTMQYIKQGFTPLTDQRDADVALRIRNHGAVESLVKGRGSMFDVDTLIAMSNMAMALKNLGYGVEYANELHEGADAVEALRNRVTTTTRYTLWAAEIKAINVLLEVHDAQLDVVDIQTLDRAVQIVKNMRGKQV